MKIFSPSESDFYKEIKSVFVDYDISNDDVKITLNSKVDPSQILEINFDKVEYEEEIKSIKYVDDYIVIGEDYVNIILLDKQKKVNYDKPIKIKGEITGSISKGNKYYGVLTTNFSRIIKRDKLVNGISFIDLLSEEVLICEITNFNIENIIGAEKDLKKAYKKINEELAKCVNSVLSYLAFTYNIIIENPRETYLNMSEKSINECNSIDIVKAHDNEPLVYFLSAEKLEYPHLKYLEYYHVLEYYFLKSSIQKVDQIIKTIITLKQTQNVTLQNKGYYEKASQLFNLFANGDDTKEGEQMKEVIGTYLGYDLIKELIDSYNMNILEFQNSIFNIESTSMSLQGMIRKDKKELEIKESSLKKKFCNELARRIYKIRNYIVHTKKGENSDVFIPSKENFSQLKNDLELIRVLAYALIVNNRI